MTTEDVKPPVKKPVVKLVYDRTKATLPVYEAEAPSPDLGCEWGAVWHYVNSIAMILDAREGRNTEKSCTEFVVPETEAFLICYHRGVLEQPDVIRKERLHYIENKGITIHISNE